MDFSGALKPLTEFLIGRSARFALVGGHALAAYGVPRATLDLDLIVEAAMQEELITFLESRGYETLYRSSGFSNHLHREPGYGRIDLIYLRGETAREVFSGCRDFAGPGGDPIPVPSAEHLIAMKAHALQNDPSRRFRELADIRSLITLPGVDRQAVREFFGKRGLLEELDELEKTL